VGDEIEVEDGVGAELRLHLGQVVSQNAEKFKIKLQYEDRTLAVEASKLRPIPCILRQLLLLLIT
jgi:hypothetical protein